MRMSRILDGLAGVVCHMDDMLILEMIKQNMVLDLNLSLPESKLLESA